MTTKSISIVIPTAGERSPKMLERTLSSLANENLPYRKIEIIVIENGPPNGCDKICGKFSELLPISYKYLETPNVSMARNLGISSSSSDLIIFFDDDIRLSGQCIQNYLTAYEKYGDNYFYGGPVRIDYEAMPEEHLLDFLPLSAKGLDFAHEITELKDTNTLFLGANHAIPRTQLDKVGNFDARGPNGINSGFVGEETRLQIRLINEGFKALYLPEALIWHYVPSNSCNLQWLKKRYYRIGLTEGELLNADGNISTLFGAPRYAIKLLIINSIKLIKSSISKTTNLEKTKLITEQQRLIGLIRGFINSPS